MYKIYRSSWIYVNILVYLTEAQVVGKVKSIDMFLYDSRIVGMQGHEHCFPNGLHKGMRIMQDVKGTSVDSAVLRAYCRYLFLGDLVWTASGREV